MDKLEKKILEFEINIEALLKNANNHKQQFITSWINSIKCLFEPYEHLIYEVLADKYIIAHDFKSYRGRTKVERWVTEKTSKESYSVYEKECKERVHKMLENKTQCPKPAFPLDFFRKITGDVSL